MKNKATVGALIVIAVIIIGAYILFSQINNNISFSFGGLGNVNTNGLSVSGLLAGKPQTTTAQISFLINNQNPFGVTISNLQVSATDAATGAQLITIPPGQASMIIAPGATTTINLTVTAYLSANSITFFNQAYQNVEQTINYTASFTVFGKNITINSSTTYP